MSLFDGTVAVATLIKWGAVVLLIVAVGIGAKTAVDAYNDSLVAAKEWEDRAEREKGNALAWKTSALHWEEETDKLGRIVTARDAALAAERRKRETVQSDFDNRRRSDPTLEAWASDPLPPYVLDLLRSLATEPGGTRSRTPESPGGLTGAGRDPVMAGRDER